MGVGNAACAALGREGTYSRYLPPSGHLLAVAASSAHVSNAQCCSRTVGARHWRLASDSSSPARPHHSDPQLPFADPQSRPTTKPRIDALRVHEAAVHGHQDSAIRRHSALSRIADVKAAQAGQGLESRPLGSILSVAPGATNRVAQTETGWNATGRHLNRQLRARQQAVSYARANKTPRYIPH